MKPQQKRLLSLIGFITLSTLGIGVAAQQSASTTTPTFYMDNTLRDVMDAVVMEAADVLWQAGSVVSFMDENGEIQTIDYSPQTDEDWHKFEHSAIALAESANMMIIPGRPLADRELYEQEAPAGELSQQEIQRLIDENWLTWTGFANLLHQTALDAMVMVENRDLDGLMEFGATLDDVCESCHQVFWYPDN